MVNDFYELMKKLKTDSIICCFAGPFTHELLIEIGETLKKKMELEKEDTSIIYNFFSIFIEETQNILNHSAERIPEIYNTNNGNNIALGIIIVGYENEHYYVLGGNCVENKQVEMIYNKLTLLQRMNKDELKKYYKEQRKKSLGQEGKSAGLGFIDVARKTSKPIEFNFNRIDDKLSFFIFKAFI